MDDVQPLRSLKRSLRQEVRRRLRQLDPATRGLEESEILDRLGRLPALQGDRRVLLYVGFLPEEIRTEPLIRACLDRGSRVALPVVDRDRGELVLKEIRSLEHDLVPGTMNIPEPRSECAEVSPETIDWALVPGLAFDRRGYRMGRGAGYYDRLLPRLRDDAPRWAAAFRAQAVDEVVTESHDQPVDAVLGADWCWICSARASGTTADAP